MTTLPADRTARDGALLILLAVSGYAVLPIFTNNLYDYGVEPLHIAIIRYALATPLYWLLLGLRRTSTETNPPPRLALLLAGPVLTIAALCAFYGLQLIPASVFILLFYSYPAMVAVIAWLRGERLPLIAWLALVLTLVGIVLTLPDLFTGLAETNLLGVGLALLNAIVVALQFLITGALLKNYNDTPRATAWFVTGAFIPLAVLGLLGGVNFPSEPGAWLNLLALAVVSTVLPIIALSAGIKRLGASPAALLSTIEPVLTLTLSALFLGERLQPVQVVGAAFIIASLVMLQLRRRPRPLEVGALSD